jgi:hypothetical protein
MRLRAAMTVARLEPVTCALRTRRDDALAALPVID